MFETGFHGFYVDLLLHAAEDKLHRAVCGQLCERFRVPVRNERIIVPDVAHARGDRALELRDERQGGAVVEPREKLARLLVENAQRSLPRGVIRVTKLTEVIQIEQRRVSAALSMSRGMARSSSSRGGWLSAAVCSAVRVKCGLVVALTTRSAPSMRSMRRSYGTVAQPCGTTVSPWR